MYKILFIFLSINKEVDLFLRFINKLDALKFVLSVV